MKSIITIVLLFIASLLSGQNAGTSGYFYGRILDKTSQRPVPYASVYNQKLKSGTISDKGGYFSIAFSNSSDTLIFSCIGFQKRSIQTGDAKALKTLMLEESIQLLAEVTISASKDDWLYSFLAGCRKEASAEKRKGKAYFELKSFSGDEQIEMVEAFFNAELEGVELEDLQMKTGRFGLRKTADRFFNSFSGSRAILQMKLFGENQFFPGNPFEFSERNMKKKFFLTLERKYLDQDADSILVIAYSPKGKQENLFSGKIWADPQTRQIHKITYECRNCSNYPFQPVFSTDSILDIAMFITKEYTKSSGKLMFRHIDFNYELKYLSRPGKAMERNYDIKTNAVLQVYDDAHVFDLPRFQFSKNCVTDYLKINAMPYNEFFWTKNDEFNIIDFENRNDAFYRRKDVITNRTWYSGNPYFVKTFEAPFISWSDKRILMKDVSGNQTKPAGSTSGTNADLYHLSVKIFMDVNTYGDSTNVITATVFDPWDTYYFLPVDSVTNCFLNIYFDICEIERRKFENEINQGSFSKAELSAKYEQLLQSLELKTRSYLKEVERGTQKTALAKWNKYDLEILGIDNISLFHLNESENGGAGK